ncbi:hypothetical protein AAFH96_12030 [Polymorphospora sp. 2-325]|uniref:Uncharacterized protein n=1 Tax=Polymorphospora lycopeni TaxID=3140240 RepID=A0ABV5CS13_9ACTN
MLHRGSPPATGSDTTSVPPSPTTADTTCPFTTATASSPTPDAGRSVTRTSSPPDRPPPSEPPPNGPNPPPDGPPPAPCTVCDNFPANHDPPCTAPATHPTSTATDNAAATVRTTGRRRRFTPDTGNATGGRADAPIPAHCDPAPVAAAAATGPVAGEPGPAGEPGTAPPSDTGRTPGTPDTGSAPNTDDTGNTDDTDPPDTGTDDTGPTPDTGNVAVPDTGRSTGPAATPDIPASNAPYATGNSGCSGTAGATPNRACNRLATNGIRLEPPTSNNPANAAGSTSARCNTRRVSSTARATSGPAIRSTSSRVRCIGSSRPGTCTGAADVRDNISFADRTSAQNACRSRCSANPRGARNRSHNPGSRTPTNCPR